jgi:hypothetical protein
MMDLKRRISSLLALVIAAAASSTAAAEKKYAPGITDIEIKIGQTTPYSGPASAWRRDRPGGVGLFQPLRWECSVHAFIPWVRLSALGHS